MIKGDRMKTNQIMETIDRELQGVKVRQRTKDSFFSLKDIVLVGNKFRSEKNIAEPIRIERYFALKQTKEFIECLKEAKQCEPHVRSKGRSSESWVHPHLMVDILLWINPRFKVEVYDWLIDYLIEYRIKSGDSYTKMCGVVYKYASRKDLFPKNISWLANAIKQFVGCDDWNKATKEQLKKRDDLQNLIADLTQTFCDSKKGIELAIQVFSNKKY